MRRILSSILFVVFSSQVIANELIVLELYNDKGLMGKHITEVKGENSLVSNTELSWNNRRLNTKEEYVFNEKGFPVEVKVSGISAFGAPVEEFFKIKDGVAKWNSRADEGVAMVLITLQWLKRYLMLRLIKSIYSHLVGQNYTK